MTTDGLRCSSLPGPVELTVSTTRGSGWVRGVYLAQTTHPLPRVVLTVVVTHASSVSPGRRGSQFRGNIEDTENVYQETSMEEVAEIFKILLTPAKIFLRVNKQAR